MDLPPRLARSLLPLLAGLALGAPALASNQNEVNFGQYVAPLTPRAVELQGAWHRMLRNETQGSVDEFADLLEEPPRRYFDRSCRNEIEPGDYAQLRRAVATVMLSGLPGHPAAQGQPGERGRFLGCLRNSRLDGLVARLEIRFKNVWRDDASLAHPTVCQWRGAGGALATAGGTLAIANIGAGHIVWLAPGSISRAVGGTRGARYRASFENIWFHEMLHIAGVEHHEMVDAAVGCCGNDSLERAQSCEILDRLVVRDLRVRSLSVVLGDDNPLWPVSEQFGSRNRLQLGSLLYAALLEQNVDRLAGPGGFSRCAAEHGRARCETDRRMRIGRAIDAMLERCDELMPEDTARGCGKVGRGTRAQIAAEIEKGLIAGE